MPRLLWPLLFLSGAAALVYEVVWLRTASLHLGATSTAIGIVVSTFLGGLALGSLLGGRWADRNPGRLLLGYAAIEAFIAVSGILVEPLLSLLTPALGGLYRAGGESSLLFNGARALLCALLLVPPTTAMGATLPILARIAASRSRDAASSTGAIYAANTLGAVAGSLAAGWLLIPNAGLFATTATAAAINLLVAASSFLLSRLPPPTSVVEEPGPPAPRWIFPAYALSGIAALACEVAWTRGLILAFGSSVYAFSLVLACFIFGLSAGGAIAARFGMASRNPGTGFAILSITCAILAAATVPLLQLIPAAMMRSWAASSTFAGVAFAQLGFAAIVVTPPAMAMGAMFPLLARLAMGARPSSGSAIGRLVAWNTTGNILGTLAASFLLLPRWGVDGTLLVAAAISLLVAAAVLFRAGPRFLLPLPMLAGALLPLVPRWDLEDVNTTPALYGRSYVEHGRRSGTSIRELLHDGDILFSRWDASGLVTVHKKLGSINLRVNGKVEASSEGDMLTQILTSHLPLVVHPAPRDVLVIGFGSGATAAAALKHDVATVDCVEISPAVIEAAEFFAEQLGHPRRDARLRLTIGDARTHVRFADRAYDAIIAQPSNLWISGNGTLFTRDHFEACRSRLRPGGLMCQWLHGYRLPPDDFRAVVATFQAVFPSASLWEVSIGGDYLLLGGAENHDPRADRYARVKDHLSRWGLHRLESLERCRLSGAEGVATLGLGARPITDNHCHVEYSSPAGLAMADTSEILDALAGLRGGSPRAGLAAAVRFARLGRVEESLRALNAAIPGCAFDPAMLGAIEIVARPAFNKALDEMDAGRKLEARRLFEAIPSDARNYEAAQAWAKQLRD